jgi:hypothetical protein
MRWRGAIEAGVAQEVAFEMEAPERAVEAGVRVRLHVDYPEELDDEQLREHVRVRGDKRGGSFEGKAPKRTRSIDGAEVQP